MMGHRMSSLPLARFCPLAPKLADRYGSGRSAAVSTAHHARCADPDSPETAALIARLSLDERVELEAMHVPEALSAHGIEWRYSDAAKELEVELPLSDGTTSLGHCDMCWVRDGWLVVGDIKRSRFTVSCPPSQSLQLAGYAAGLLDDSVERIVLAYFFAEEGTWSYSDPIGVADFFSLIEAVDAASTHYGDTGSHGPHCRDCFNSHHCPEYLAPAGSLEGLDSPITDQGQALLALRRFQAIREALKLAEEQVKGYVRANGPLVVGDKQWGRFHRKGKAGFDKKRLAAEHPELVKEYTKEAGVTSVYDWRNIE